MARGFLALGAILLVLLLGVPACSTDSKAPSKGATPPPSEPGPKPGQGKAG